MANFKRVASVQFETVSERKAPEAGEIVLAETTRVMETLRGFGLDLVVFGEGVEAHGMTVETAEELARPGPFLNLYRDFARREGCTVAGSVKLRRGSKVHNSIAFLGPGGEVLGSYDKSFLTMSELEDGLSPGSGPSVVPTPAGRLGGIICFDLNFEELRQAYRTLRPDVLCFASMYHGGLMQQMWAYDCRAFFISALQFHGCGVLDPFGRPRSLTDCYRSVAMATINLDRVMVHLDFNRDTFADIERRYLGEVVVDVPANVGSALIYSLSEKRSALEVAEEFGLELLDDYFTRAREANLSAAPGRPRGVGAFPEK